MALCCRVVEFASSSDMKNAIEKLNETELNGRVITITEDRGRGSGARRRRYELSISTPSARLHIPDARRFVEKLVTHWVEIVMLVNLLKNAIAHVYKVSKDK